MSSTVNGLLQPDSISVVSPHIHFHHLLLLEDGCGMQQQQVEPPPILIYEPVSISLQSEPALHAQWLATRHCTVFLYICSMVCAAVLKCSAAECVYHSSARTLPLYSGVQSCSAVRQCAPPQYCSVLLLQKEAALQQVSLPAVLRRFCV